ncbi:MAG: 3-oxoacyl-ACP reductase FabG [Calditrichia bacterium]
MNRSIFITGATGALGQIVSNILLTADYSLIIPYRNQDKFDSIFNTFLSNGNVTGIKADLSSINGIEELHKEMKIKKLSFDACVHLMGGFQMGTLIADTPLSDFDKMFSLNFQSALSVFQLAFNHFRKTGGKIIAIGARPALEFPPFMGAYSISKAALMNLLQSMANEGKAYSISTHCIIPSIIDTPANRKAMPDEDYSKWTSPESIAKTILQILELDAPGITHSVIELYNQA